MAGGIVAVAIDVKSFKRCQPTCKSAWHPLHALRPQEQAARMNEIACAHRELAARVYDIAHHVNRLIADALDMPCRLDSHVQIVAHVDNQILHGASELAPI